MYSRQIMKNTCLIFFAILFSFHSHAEQGDSYVGIQMNVFQVEIDDANTMGENVTRDVQPAALSFRVGAYLNNWLVIEGTYAIGMGDDEIEDTDEDLKIQSMIGLSAVANYSVTGPLRIFGKVGAVRTRYVDTLDVHAQADGLLLAVGFSLDVSESSRIVWDFNYLPDGNVENNNNELKANSIGFGIEFNL